MALNLFRGFEFRKRDTFVHNLDPRTKIFVSLCILVCTLIFSEIVPLLLIFIASISLIVLARSLREWYQSVKGLSVLFLLILVINSFTYSLTFGIAMCIRLLNFVTAFSLFFLTTHPDDLAHALLSMKVPFEVAFTFSMATRYVPTLAREAQRIAEAQMSRGLELQRGGFLQRIRNLIPLLVPLIICSIKRALSIAESLESRCFGATKKRTYLHELRLSTRDFVIIFVFSCFFSFMILVKYVIGYPSILATKLPI